MKRAGSRAVVDVVVIGAGAIGAATAYELALRGVEVLLIDQAATSAAGCSGANAGLLVPSHSEPLTTPGNIRTGLRQILFKGSTFHLKATPSILPWLARFVAASTEKRAMCATDLLRNLGVRGLQRHADYAQSGIATSFSQRGMLDVFTDEYEATRAIESLRSHPTGYRYEVVSRRSLQEAVPGIVGHAGGIFFPDEAHCDGRVFTEAMVGAARELGVRTLFREPVREIIRSGRRVVGVTTSHQTVLAGSVVLAAGIASSQMARQVGVTLPLAAAKGYAVDLEAGPEDVEMAVGFKRSMVVATPYPDRLRLAGALELSAGDTALRGTALVEHRVSAIRAAATNALPHLARRRLLQTTAGLRPCSADGLPLVGPSQRLQGLVLATGHGQQGMILAPVTGQLVAEAITSLGCDSGIHPALRPDRFGLVKQDRRAGLGCSR